MITLIVVKKKKHLINIELPYKYKISYFRDNDFETHNYRTALTRIKCMGFSLWMQFYKKKNF